MRGALCDDPEILLSAKHYKIEPESRFKVLNTSRVEFYIQPERFDAWLLKHQRPTSTNFVLAKKYDYKVDNQCRLSYECQCTGKKRIRKDRVQGGVTGKTRNRAPGIKQGCGAKIFATRAREHIETRNSRGFEGLFIWQTGSDTLLVESFTTKGLLMRSKLTFQDLPLGISCRAPVTISS
ncbi:hypothetical protein BCR41DRAFT_353379 [Lobosporangium transversale]|uniref:Uncharacterized protein n=1 Tax=Lobosporangium transversale TaxID=64571 RepID=A0A1Y2GN11_9FUNG|nr:hypothetical protein BCR41DRAFT_353379 [Lobosporangium transversale]ORZ16026.1 hypothetical protein BCR41DRAFT_353379 [Lobosporangium transversale]|eukprot:XP_021881373.1 hypothetical protein BCR41DRAFT_353379 [Lobosporangium transversale]